MDGIFGIGIPEILIVVVLALIILGPEDMVKTARKLGRWVYRVYHSPTWRAIMTTSQEIRELPTKFVREAGLEDTVQDLKQTTSEVKAQLKATTGDVTSEIKEATSDATTEVKEARQELKAETGEATPPAAEPASPETAPGPELALEAPPALPLVDPDGDGNAEAPAQPEPFTPRPEETTPPAEHFSI